MPRRHPLTMSHIQYRQRRVCVCVCVWFCCAVSCSYGSSAAAACCERRRAVTTAAGQIGLYCRLRTAMLFQCDTAIFYGANTEASNSGQTCGRLCRELLWNAGFSVMSSAIGAVKPCVQSAWWSCSGWQCDNATAMQAVTQCQQRATRWRRRRRWWF